MGNVSGCNDAGELSLNGGPATAIGPIVSFHEDNALNAVFYVPDSVYTDNVGGISLVLTQVNPVPEPETYALPLAGLGVVGLMARRRKQQD